MMIKTGPLNAAAGKSDADLTDIISKGIPKTKMKGFGEKLSAEQIQDLVAGIKALK
jgi:mono/diheme cytochrome c family protein